MGFFRSPANPLVYPGTLPGFNPLHPAAGIPRYSGVAANGTMLNLLSGKVPTLHGSLSSSVSTFGPVLTTITDGNYLSVTAFNETPKAVTFAAIYTSAGSAPNFPFIFNNNGNDVGSHALALVLGNPTQKPSLYIGGAAATVAGIPVLTANVPYFIAVSASSGTQLAVCVKNLVNGEVISVFDTSFSSTLVATTTSTFNIGGNNLGATLQMYGSLAAVMYSVNSFMTARALRQWAEAPWDYWYPPTRSYFMAMIGPPGAVITPRAPFNLPFLGW